MFSWAGSNDELELWKANGFHPVPLAATDIQMGLKTGLIDTIPTTPLYALWNQCFTMAKYMCDVKWAPLVGATIVSKAAWEKIPEAQRGPMLQAARDAGQELRSGIRGMGDKAIDAMTDGLKGKKEDKLTIVHADAAALADWHKQTEAVYPKMRGKLIPENLFDEVRRLHEEYRAKAKGGAK
jgi:TRAP-type C4-dicarboxylate transport system substrate-binding protein